MSTPSHPDQQASPASEGHGAGSENPRHQFPKIRRVGMWRSMRWLKLGWQDLWAAPRMSLFYGLCFAGMGQLLQEVLAHAPQYLSAMTCGFLLLGPLLSLGLYDISRRLEQQQSGMLVSLFSMRGRWSNIGILTLVLAVIMLLWARASLVIFALFYNKGMPDLQGFLAHLFSLENLEFIAVYGCVGMLFASIVFAISWVAIPLMLDRDSDAISAMIVSVVALFANLPCAMLWGLTIVGFVVAGFASWGLGLIIVLPIVGHATWHAYRDIVVPN